MFQNYLKKTFMNPFIKANGIKIILNPCDLLLFATSLQTDSNMSELMLIKHMLALRNKGMNYFMATSM
jgi:hypothetical protein